MFNFDTTYTKGKNTFKIVNNDLVEGSENLSAVNANALLEHWLDGIIIPQVNKTSPSKDFSNLVKEVTYLREAINEVKRIKRFNCSYGNKTLEELDYKAENTNSSFYKKIKGLTAPQQLVVGSKADKLKQFSSYDLYLIYDAVKDSDSELQSWWKELNDFDYDSFGESKESILRESNASRTYTSVLEKIEHFKVILKEAGEDIVNWTDQKISLRFTKLGINRKAYSIRDYVNAYVENLLKSGVKQEKKIKTSKDKLEDIIKKGNPTQEDYFRYYKQGSKYDTSSVLKELNLDYLFQLIESDLKCVKEKLIWGRSFSSDGELIRDFLCEKSQTKEDYNRIVAWATPRNVSLAFMVKHKDHSTKTEVIDFSKTSKIPTDSLVDESFYQTCLVKIDTPERFKLSNGLTYQYLARMNEQDKVIFLNKLEGYLIEERGLFEVYKDVEYSLIRDTILKSKKLLHHLSIKLVKENDNEALVKSAKEACVNLEDFQKKEIFKKLTFEEKKDVIKDESSCKEFCNGHYTGAIKTLSDKENLSLLQDLIEIPGATRYVSKIFKHFKDIQNWVAIQEANKIVKGLENVEALPKEESVIGCLSVDTKVELLNKGINLKVSRSYSGYSNYRNITSISLGSLFFNDFKREDILKVTDEKYLTSYGNIKFLAHVLTKDELVKCASREISGWHKNTSQGILEESFFRHNVELLGYGFLKQFKKKEAFKLVVGDRRNSSNRYFGERLLKKLNVSNSIDFMCS